MQVVVEAKTFRRMFQELKPVLRNSDDGGLLGFTLQNHQLTVTCKNGIIYERKFPTDADGEAAVTVLYKNIADLLPGSGLVYIDVTPAIVRITTDGFASSLQPAYGEVTPYKQRCSTFRIIKPAHVQLLAQACQALSPVAKSLKREYPVQLTGKAAILKYPTVWLETPFEGFSTTIGTRELHTIANFRPTQVGTTDGAIEFTNDSAMLAVAVTPVPSTKLCADILKNPHPAVEMPALTAQERVQSFARAVSGSCQLTFFRSGYGIHYNKDGTDMLITIGHPDDAIYTLDTYTEYLPFIFRFIEEKTFWFTKADNAVMLEVPNEVKLLFAIVR